MLRLAKRWPDRTWAVESAGGVGVQLAQRLVADGERVIDVPPKLSTRARMFDVGHGRGWIAGENPAVGDLYDTWVEHVQAAVTGPASQAWQEGPVTQAAGMVLNDFGPASAAPAVAAVEAAIAYRFGLRRLMWPSWVARRLCERGLYPPVAGGDEPGAAAAA